MFSAFRLFCSLSDYSPPFGNTSSQVDRIVLNPFFGKSVMLNYETLKDVGLPKSPKGDHQDSQQ